MGFNTIEKNTIIYPILKFWVTKSLGIFFKISVDDQSDVKEGEPIIYAPNHQNALIDPLVIASSRKGQTVFLARGDIFNTKIIAELLYTIKMLPVFRIRDGYDQLHKNQAIFDKTMDVIASGNGLCVFPEANHAGFRRLRMLKKGVSRMAFQTQLNYNDDLNVKIVPVGMEYEHYYWFRSKVHLTYGKSISVKDYLDEYKQDAPKGLNALNKAISKGIKPLMVNIPFQDQEYEMTNFLTEVNYNNKNIDLGLSFADKVKLDQGIVKEIVESKENNLESFETLISKTEEYKKVLDEVETDDYSVGVIANKQPYLYFYPILILTFTMYLLGLVLNYIPYKLPYFVTRKIKDVQMHSTMYFAVGTLFVFPIFYMVYLFALKVYFGITVALILLVGIGVLGLFSYEYFKLYVKLKRINRIKNSDKLNEVLNLRKEVVSMLERL